MGKSIEPGRAAGKHLRRIRDRPDLDMPAHTIRVELPHHLRTLASITGHEATVHVQKPTIGAVLDALEAEYPMLCGTIRDHVTLERRAFLRFFACMQDISFEPVSTALPAAVVDGREPLIILGAVAGGRGGVF